MIPFGADVAISLDEIASHRQARFPCLDEALLSTMFIIFLLHGFDGDRKLTRCLQIHLDGGETGYACNRAEEEPADG